MMKARELRKEARESLKGHRGKAGGTYLVYMAFSFLMAFVLGFMSVFIPPIFTLILELVIYLIIPEILYGCITVLMRIRRRENVSAFSCVGEGFSKFWKVFVCNFWICIKLLPWILMFVAAIVLSSMSIYSGVNDYLFDAYSLSNDTLDDVGLNNELEILEEDHREEPVDLSELYAALSFIFMVVSIVMLVIRGFRYSLVNFLIFDEPDMKAREIVNKSKELMKGNCGRIFCLNLSFFGWSLLLFIGICASYYMISVGSLSMIFGGVSGMFLVGIICYFVTLFLTIFFLTPYMQMANICFYEELTKPNEEDSLRNVVENSITEDNGGVAII